MTSSAALPNTPNVNGPLNTASSNSSSSRAQLKMTTSVKGADGARKQAGSPVDGAQKKPRAWQGTNPITQRPSNANSNGVVSTPKPAHVSTPLSVESASPMRHLSDRMYYLLANLSGLPGHITLKNGEKYTGVLSGTSLDPTEMRYVFKMVKKVQAAGDAQVNGTAEASDDYIGTGENYVVSFDMSDVADFHVSNVILDKTQAKGQNGISGFRTDTDISRNMAVRERPLEKWEPAPDTNANLSLESSGQSTGWDQFAVNERLFGVRSDYDENLYTTTIDRNHPQYAERVAHAERKAREIESSSALNAHVSEERAQNATADREGEEEDLYSGVYRPLAAGGPNTYTPPARRPPTSQSTVKGAPVDPAIISSQLARPDPTATTASQRTSSPADRRASPEPTKADVLAKPSAPAPTKADPPKEVTAKIEAKPPVQVQPAATQAQKPSHTLKQAAGIPPRKSGRPENATANVEHDLLDSFKQFSAAEKLRMTERQRSIARESKAVKLNDLKKFSQNFKLNTPVPTDLVPILAKDEGKQQLIVQKALRTVEEMKATPPKPAPATTDAKSAPRPTNTKPEATPPASNPSADRTQNQRARPGQNQYGLTSMRDRGGHNQNMNQVAPRNHGPLSSRLQLNQQQHKQQGTVQYNGIPQPIPNQDMRNLPPTGPSVSPSGSGVQTPMSSASSRFNVKAHEFKPNPAANTFQPLGTPSNHSSPRPESVSRQDPPRKIQFTSFFGNHRPTKKPLDLHESFNPVTRLIKEAAQEPQKARQYANNGGIQPPYHTYPTWDFPQMNKEKGYVDMFERPASAPISAPHNVMGNGPIPHQHQLPPPFQGPQGVHQGQTPQQTPRHLPVQPHHGQGPHHFDSQHMQFSHSNSSVQPSPRPMPPYMYGSQPQPMPGYPQPVPMQSFGMSPGVQHVNLRGGQGGPPFVSPPGPGMGGQMMTNQPSNGPYMGMPGNPQMQMYSGAPGHGYPQYPGQMPTGPGANGFPSPRPGGAPLMSHQGSQQGHQQQHMMYMQPGAQGPPMFAQAPMAPMRGPYPQPHQQHYGSPHQHHQFPQQHRGTPSGSYSQPMMQQHSLPPQIPPTGPANHGPEGGEEVK
ncbi:hypothetical protein CC80DRAFT_493007 [Byssothecium circinans]|uniref:LsmAD domain-containing protein n=1 Tax=Byssothecium circinans TaxID=147558 RepID=A0A6A5U2W9_9PLEO|nr:hypothetical protein CC80DRAFT_493007 [Byssothecium circinans]